MNEESYVVRIYRKGPRTLAARRARVASTKEAANTAGRRRAHDQVAIAGTVEDVEHGMRRYFRDIEELWAILSAPPRLVTGRRTGKDAPKK